MRRWAIRIGVFLILGAIVNVAVAWGLSCGIDIFDFYRGRRHSEQSFDESYFHVVESVVAIGSRGWRYIKAGYDDPAYLIEARHDGPPYATTTRPAIAGLPNWFPEHPDIAELTPGAPFNLQVWVHAYGYPIPALYWSYEWDSRTRSWSVSRGLNRSDSPYRRANGSTWPRALPLAPIWPGFAINTVFYAIILWLLFAGPFVLRRRRRIRRGLCPKCAYDLRGTPEGATACPECGALRVPAPPEHAGK